MKFLSRLVVILAIIGFTVFGYDEVWGADWKYFASGVDWTFWWYDTQGVTYRPNMIIHVWVKRLKADEIMDMVRSGAKLTVSELEQMTSERSYEQVLMEIDCVKKTADERQKLNYDSNGVLKSGESILGAREIIPSGSIAERLYKTVCKNSWQMVLYWQR
jgi:hypothetical protein